MNLFPFSRYPKCNWTIHVRTPNRFLCLFNILPHFTIHQLKTKISQEIHCQPQQLLMTFEERLLMNDFDTLEEVNIKNGSKVSIIWTSEEFEIMVQLECERGIVCTVATTDKIRHVKTMLCELTGILPHAQKITFKDREIQECDDHFVDTIGLTSGSTIELTRKEISDVSTRKLNFSTLKSSMKECEESTEMFHNKKVVFIVENNWKEGGSVFSHIYETAQRRQYLLSTWSPSQESHNRVPEDDTLHNVGNRSFHPPQVSILNDDTFCIPVELMEDGDNESHSFMNQLFCQKVTQKSRSVKFIIILDSTTDNSQNAAMDSAVINTVIQIFGDVKSFHEYSTCVALCVTDIPKMDREWTTPSTFDLLLRSKIIQTLLQRQPFTLSVHERASSLESESAYLKLLQEISTVPEMPSSLSFLFVNLTNSGMNILRFIANETDVRVKNFLNGNNLIDAALEFQQLFLLECFDDPLVNSLMKSIRSNVKSIYKNKLKLMEKMTSSKNMKKNQEVFEEFHKVISAFEQFGMESILSELRVKYKRKKYSESITHYIPFIHSSFSRKLFPEFQPEESSFSDSEEYIVPVKVRFLLKSGKPRVFDCNQDMPNNDDQFIGIKLLEKMNELLELKCENVSNEE